MMNRGATTRTRWDRRMDDKRDEIQTMPVYQGMYKMLDEVEEEEEEEEEE